MPLFDFFSYSVLLVTVVAAAVVILTAFRTNTARVWKEEAESQKACDDRLEADLTEINMTADQFVTALKAEGLGVSEMPGWRTNNRNSIKAWGPGSPR
ncbi:hypothetical protein [Streptomyces ziwulingensis]|uniref:Uncharacterized protein n=1 Tax=Streptomyces ziwulingensis TaxID=1045501 RepID=A0ABP9BFP5_9ACTN